MRERVARDFVCIGRKWGVFWLKAPDAKNVYNGEDLRGVLMGEGGN